MTEARAAMTIDEVIDYLKHHERKELLRLVAVGSVDDGKSTLIGRLLHDTHGIYEDQLAAVQRASKTRGSVGGALDLALLTDGLKAEREQGITIDVAYRYFSTEQRKFIIADTPGHTQYTRNMATGASTADVAVILIDARQGVLQQSRRHAYIASLLGIPHLAVCINKMDLVGFDRDRYDTIVKEFESVVKELRFRETRFFPISAVDGDNVVHASERTPWHEGDTLLAYLEQVPVDADQNRDDFRFPVQYVLRPDLNYRGFCGQVASGVVAPGDEIMVLPSGKRSRVLSIDSFEGPLAEAFAPMSVTLRLKDEIDISRGDMIAHPDNQPHASQHVEAHVVWMSETPLDVNGSYLIKHTTRMARANVDEVLGRIDLETLREEPAATLQLNDIGRLTLSLNQPIFFDPYTANRNVGAFVMIDALRNDTVGAGMIVGAAAGAPLHVDDTRPWSLVTREARRKQLGHPALVIGFAHYDPERHRAIAQEIERRLFEAGVHVALVDVERLSDPTRSPKLVADVVEPCVASGLVTILSTGLPREAQRSGAVAQLDETVAHTPEAAVETDVVLQGWLADLLKRLGSPHH
jgi:bifunctional enzyme CysN/CysC/sulfate adenylyltransferase subunit 1